MASLLEPYIPRFSEFANAANQGYALGETMRGRNLLVDAGKQMAAGNARGARNTLYAGGNFDEGGKIDARLRADAAAAQTQSLEKAAKINGIIGNLAMSADTPEKWARAIETAKGMGIDVSRYGDFSAREFALAQVGKTDEMLKMELERRKADRAQPTYEFTKTGVGNKFTGEFRPYAEGEAGKDPELTMEQGKYEQGLRKEYTALTSDLRGAQGSLSRMRAGAQANSGAGDIAMVYSYMKMLDPGSTVMQGEYATAEQTGGLPAQVVGLYNKIISGQRLTPAQRQEFLGAAGAIVKDREQQFERTRQQFEGIAKSSGADPSRIMLDEGMSQAAPATTRGAPSRLQPGHVEDGFRFRGGDPADPNSWEQVR
jgi:hypothetical protein